LRFLLVFFALFTPLSWLLWFLAGDSPARISLPQPERDDEARAVLVSKEVPRVPIDGEITAFKNGRIQRFHKKFNYVELWVHIGGIERVDDKPRLQHIRCAIFGQPSGDNEARLRMTIDAPYLEGEPLALLGARSGTVREIVLGGGVIVRDEWGRPVAEIGRLVIDLDKEEVRTDGPVLFESPEKHAQLRGTGLVSDLQFNAATLLSNVKARLPLAEGGGSVAVLSCRGPATLVRLPETDEYIVTLEQGAHIEHELARGDCDRITAFFRKTSGEKDGRQFEVERVMLEGEVSFELDREIARGLESFTADSITIYGEREIVLAGGKEPVRAVRRGPLEMFGLADRVTDLAAPEIRIGLTADAGKAKEQLESLSFPSGVHLKDRDGSGEVRAGRFVFDARAGRIEADRGVTATSPGRKLVAERVVVSRPPDRDDVVIVGVFGKKRFELRPEGQLGPLSRGALGLLTFTSTEPLYLERLEDKTIVRTSGSVRVLGDDRELLRCRSIQAAVRGKELQSMKATTEVVMHDPETEVDIRADKLVFDAKHNNEVRLFGKPAVVEQPGKGIVRAPELYYREDGSFGALPEVDAEFTLAQGKAAGLWKFRADWVKGLLHKDKRPEWVFISGDVRATGPNGERLEADAVRYDRETATLFLTGEPARLRQGDELSYEGKRLTVRLLEKEGSFELREVTFEGGSTDLVLRPKPQKGDDQRQFSLWKIRLLGKVSFDGKRIRIPAGAKLSGFDEQGRLAVEGEADDVTIDVVREGKSFRPTALRAKKRVVMAGYKNGKLDSKVTAKTLEFLVGNRNIDIGGGGKLERPGEKPVRFREAEFELTDHGVDLKYLSELTGEWR